MRTTSKPPHRLSLRDRLSQLTLEQAAKLLGPQGRRLILQGGTVDFDLKADAFLGGDLFRLRLPNYGQGRAPVVTITVKAEAKNRLHWNCTACDEPCEHVGAAFSAILENKTFLGLATPPKERIPIESLTEQELVSRAMTERAQRATSERMKIRSS